MADKAMVQIMLTPEQREQIEQSTGKQVAVVELKPERLECRAAPRLVGN
jgi:hypothetical protein